MAVSSTRVHTHLHHDIILFLFTPEVLSTLTWSGHFSCPPFRLFLPPPCHTSPSRCPSVLIPVRLFSPLVHLVPPAPRWAFVSTSALPHVPGPLGPPHVCSGSGSFQILAAYKALMERLLSMLGAEDPTQKSKEIIQLETRLANVSQMCSRARVPCVRACEITSPLLPDHRSGIRGPEEGHQHHVQPHHPQAAAAHGSEREFRSLLKHVCVCVCERS